MRCKNVVSCPRIDLLILLWCSLSLENVLTLQQSNQLGRTKLSVLYPDVDGSKKLLSSPSQDRRRVVSGLIQSTIGALAFPKKARAIPTTTPTQLVAKSTKESALQSLQGAAEGLRSSDSGIVFSTRLNYPHPGLRQIASPVKEWNSDLEIVVEALLASMESDATTPVQYGIDARIIVLKGSASPLENGRPITLVNPTILVRSSEDKMVPWREYCMVVSNSNDIVWPEGVAPSAKTPGSLVPINTKNNNNAQQQSVEVDLLRDAFVEIAAQDYLTGKPIRKVLQGEAARAFQHELDHLNGILVIDHAALEDLPLAIAFLEEQDHTARQKQAFARTIYQGNGPLYY